MKVGDIVFHKTNPAVPGTVIDLVDYSLSVMVRFVLPVCLVEPHEAVDALSHEWKCYTANLYKTALEAYQGRRK